MSDKIDISYKRLNISFEEIKKYINNFQYEKYSFLDIKIASYKKNGLWIAKHIRIDFTLINNKKSNIFTSKEGNIAFFEESLNLKLINSKISSDKDGAYLIINKKKLYFENSIRNISEAEILNGIKKYDRYHLINAEKKIYFAYYHEMYRSKSKNIGIAREKFDDEINGIIASGEIFYKKFMNINYGISKDYFILIIFPIYSFNFNVDVIEDRKQKYIDISYNISDELKESIEITYKLSLGNECPLKERITLKQDFQGRIEFRVYWYGDDKFISKGTILYEEEINIERLVNPILKELSIIDKEVYNDPFIIKKFSEFEKLFLNEKLIECLLSLDLICSKLELKEIAKWINIELKGFIENTDKLADLPSYREFNAKLKHMGTEVPERIHWNLFIPLSEIILKIKNNENISRTVEHDVLNGLFSKYFAGITIAIIESTQLKQITTGVLKNIEQIYKYLNNSIEKKEISKKRKEIRNGLIEKNFSEFFLPEYNEFRDLINICACDSEFFRLTPILLRTIFENLLREIFISCLANEHKNLYFNKGRIRDFSELISLFNLLKESFFKKNYATNISQIIIDYLNDIRDNGNLTVHEILNNIEPNYADNKKDQIKITFDNLLQLYRRIINGTKNIQIQDQNLINRIHKKLNISNEMKKVNKKISSFFHRRKSK